MARPLRIEFPGAFYHITSRGNEQKDIFKSQRDRARFLSYLESATQRYGGVIHTYCLMNNHYHLLLETPLGNLSQIMRHINGAYTTYFNTKWKRAGHLLQGRYKAILVDVDEYAKELSRYIHLNPVRTEIVDRPEEYSWSSYRYYIGLEKRPDWLITDFTLSYFGTKVSNAQKRYRRFVEGMIREEYDSPLKDTVASTILGKEDFVEEIKRKYLNRKKVDRNLPALRELSPRLTVKGIIEEVNTVIGEDTVLLNKLGLYFCHRYSGSRLKEIGKHFGVGESAVSQASHRLEFKMSKDYKLRKKIKQIEKRLNMSNV